MPNPEQLERLKQGVEGWNKWRDDHPSEPVDLTDIDVSGIRLSDADLSEANLWRANLTNANLSVANLSGANLSGADLWHANLWHANLSDANLSGANLSGANLSGGDLSGADLSGADLSGASLVSTYLEGADLTDCRVYGISAWDVHLAGAKQAGLVITPEGTTEITVDEVAVAQFIYLLLNNKNVRAVIDTITSKVVLILGRFTPERKAVLDALRNSLRAKNYSPIVFDFEKPTSRDLTETIRVLAGLARFVIADITDAKSIPQELMAIVPDLPSVPVQPLLLAAQQRQATRVPAAIVRRPGRGVSPAGSPPRARGGKPRQAGPRRRRRPGAAASRRRPRPCARAEPLPPGRAGPCSRGW